MAGGLLTWTTSALTARYPDAPTASMPLKDSGIWPRLIHSTPTNKTGGLRTDDMSLEQLHLSRLGLHCCHAWALCTIWNDAMGHGLCTRNYELQDMRIYGQGKHHDRIDQEDRWMD
ncbi:hypothetical protein J3459_012376 [Metarhizium acridum]|uniref:uncharacterized protein n=1 Tax=Metarhizium acridum TaxID=92637 RepID=UPI001C6D239E|nr:hypothetical protein J3458_021266 [Metarhizium acridum]KAG8418542.1 hypothetical protein J3459_012376 [Metarhizium acridum]